MGLKVTDERLQEENQMAKFNGKWELLLYKWYKKILQWMKSKIILVAHKNVSQYGVTLLLTLRDDYVRGAEQSSG